MFKRKYFILFFLFFFLFNLGLNNNGNVLSLIYYSKGVKALNKKDYSESIKYLKKAKDVSPSSLQIRKALATALNNYSFSFSEEERERAIELLEEATQVLPEEPLLKKNLAALYNNWGLKLQKEGDFEGTIEKFKKAIEIYPASNTFQKNLADTLKIKGFRLFEKGEFEAAIKSFNEATKYLPEDFDLWMMLGEANYQGGDLEKAINCWEEARKLSPQNLILKGRLAQAKKEWEVQKDFAEFSSPYFKINFSTDISRDKASEIYNYVKEAIWSVGRDLGFYPKQKFSVFIYQSEQFEEVFDARKHLAGLYDGRIHLHISEQTSPERIDEVVRHEYTHAVVFWITKGSCPLWFNEGLACYLEKKDKIEDFSEIKKLARENKLIPLSEFTEGFLQLADFNQANLAYKEAQSIIKYIVDEYNFWKIQKMLNLFGEGKNEDEVIREVLQIEPQELEENWQKKLVYSAP